MSGIKKLAGQTIWYGASSIAARFINYLLTPYLTAQLLPDAFGEMSLLYAAIPFLNVIFTYGLETAYFRFASSKDEREQVYNTSTVSLIFSTVLFTAIVVMLNNEIATLLRIPAHPEYVTLCALIIAFDALTILAFARLRFDERPVKFATVRIAGIMINIAFVFFFLSVCPQLKKDDPNSFFGAFYDPDKKVLYIILANLIQSIVTFCWKACTRWKDYNKCQGTYWQVKESEQRGGHSSNCCR